MEYQQSCHGEQKVTEKYLDGSCQIDLFLSFLQNRAFRFLVCSLISQGETTQ